MKNKNESLKFVQYELWEWNFKFVYDINGFLTVESYFCYEDSFQKYTDWNLNIILNSLTHVIKLLQNEKYFQIKANFILNDDFGIKILFLNF